MSTSEFDIYALAAGSVVNVQLHGLTPIGGAGTAGLELKSLKQAGDYAILARQAGGLAIHPLRGQVRQPQTLTNFQSLQIDDLTLVVLPKTSASPSKDSDVFGEVLNQMSQVEDSEKPLMQALLGIMKLVQHERGLIISKKLTGEFEVLLGHGVQTDDSWMSEKLVQECLQKKQPVLVNNVVGSSFNSSESLLSTGLLSVFCWPLVLQGNTLGVLMTCSRRPHMGLSAQENQRALNLSHLAAVVSGFRLRELSLRKEIDRLRQPKQDLPFQTDSQSLRQTCDLAKQVANSDLAVLIQGETGVGKEVLAKWLHERSGRGRGPFIAVNCGAIPSELLESLLFGHKKGAFTSAVRDQEGKIQQAHGGTLFLDEIGDIPAALQPKLLRVLNDKMVEPLGSSRPVQVDVRILAATHRPLKEMVAAKTFRDDLYYRLAEMTLWIPPLRERPTDIVLIANTYLKEIGGEKTLAEDARLWLLEQTWKGNVRELRSVLKRAAVLSTGTEIKKKHFMLGQENGSSTDTSESQDWLGAADLEAAKHRFVRDKINQALELTSGNRTKAAQLLGITARTLFRYLEGGMKDMSL